MDRPSAIRAVAFDDDFLQVGRYSGDLAYDRPRLRSARRQWLNCRTVRVRRRLAMGMHPIAPMVREERDGDLREPTLNVEGLVRCQVYRPSPVGMLAHDDDLLQTSPPVPTRVADRPRLGSTRAQLGHDPPPDPVANGISVTSEVSIWQGRQRESDRCFRPPRSP